jgi:hypothetical protein
VTLFHIRRARLQIEKLPSELSPVSKHGEIGGGGSQQNEVREPIRVEDSILKLRAILAPTHLCVALVLAAIERFLTRLVLD